MTVFLLRCDGSYALQKRPDTGLLAGLWQFPNLPGQLSTQEALAQADAWGLHPKELQREIYRHHIFTHIRWDMKGIFLEVCRADDRFVWLRPEEIEKQAALPTAFRQFWEETEHV